MNLTLVSRRQRALPYCAPFSETRAPDRAMRIAVHRASKGKATTEVFPGSKTLTAQLRVWFAQSQSLRKYPSGSPMKAY